MNDKPAPRHFIDLADVDAVHLRQIIDTARNLKNERRAGIRHNDKLPGRKLAMIFEKNSTRTRVSFEVAILELGGHPVILPGKDTQLSRGESVGDTARVLSRYVDAIMLRANAHESLVELAEHATVPVINGLTNKSHPCQIMADIMTFEEHIGPIAGKTVAWVGDGNNVANSWISAASKFQFTLALACPQELEPAHHLIIRAKEQGANIEIAANPEAAVKNADAVVTDTWVSMGDKDGERRVKLLSPYQVNKQLMDKTGKKAIFMHCLPAHVGEEVTEDVFNSPHSVVWDEAENRLHAQKAILLWCLGVI